MTITSDEKWLLNNKAGSIARKVQLGTLIENAESVTAGEIALASAKLLVGNASGVGAAVSVSGDATMDNAGALTIAALAVETSMLAADAVDGTKLADDAVSLEHLDSGITPGLVAKFGAQYTTTGGAAAEAITVTGALSTDISHVRLVDDGTNNVTLTSWAVTADTLTVTFSGNPGNDVQIEYLLFRAVA